jgi:hypothetical protein
MLQEAPSSQRQVRQQGRQQTPCTEDYSGSSDTRPTLLDALHCKLAHSSKSFHLKENVLEESVFSVETLTECMGEWWLWLAVSRITTPCQ